MEGAMIERCSTGIEGFDQICQGGFVRNSSNIIIGGPGSGKTTFLLQFLYNGATKFNENGLYCSFEPDIIETLKDALSYNWDFSKLNEQNKVKFLKFSPQTTIEDLKSELTKLIAKYNIKRICFDPVSVLALNLTDAGKIREVIFDLASLMKRLNVTSVLSDESLENPDIDSLELGNWNKTDIINFLTDSLTVFYESNPNTPEQNPTNQEINNTNQADRSIRILKMRRTSHTRIPIGMKISNQGLEIFPEEQPQTQSQQEPPPIQQEQSSTQQQPPEIPQNPPQQEQNQEQPPDLQPK